MQQEAFAESLFESLITGDRPAARAITDKARKALGGPLELITGLFWPTHQQVEKLYKADQLTRMSHHMAVRLLRQLIDQNAAMLSFDYSKGKNVLAFCGPSENEELGAQMSVDVLEAHGFEVRFGGNQQGGEIG